MKKSITNRGFGRLAFYDLYKEECSLQMSSKACKPCIWLGDDRNRMHLDQDMVKELLPFLLHFIETGNIFKGE